MKFSARLGRDHVGVLEVFQVLLDSRKVYEGVLFISSYLVLSLRAELVAAEQSTGRSFLLLPPLERSQVRAIPVLEEAQIC